MADIKDKYLITEDELGLEPDTVKLLQAAKGMDSPDIEQMSEVKRYKAEREALQGQTKEAYSEMARAKLIENMMGGIIKAYAAYRGMKSGEDLSKIEITPSEFPEIALKGKLADIEERKKLAEEGVQIAREDLASRIQGAVREREFKSRARESALDRQLREFYERQRLEREAKDDKASTFAAIKTNLNRLDTEAKDKLKEFESIKYAAQVTPPKVGTEARVKYEEKLTKLEELTGMDLSSADPALVKQASKKYADSLVRDRQKVGLLNNIVGISEASKISWEEGHKAAWKILQSADPESMATDLPLGEFRRKDATYEDYLAATSKADMMQKLQLRTQQMKGQIPKGTVFDTPAEDAMDSLGEGKQLSKEEFEALPKAIQSAVIPVEEFKGVGAGQILKKLSQPLDGIEIGVGNIDNVLFSRKLSK